MFKSELWRRIIGGAARGAIFGMCAVIIFFGYFLEVPGAVWRE